MNQKVKNAFDWIKNSVVVVAIVAVVVGVLETMFKGMLNWLLWFCGGFNLTIVGTIILVSVIVVLIIGAIFLPWILPRWTRTVCLYVILILVVVYVTGFGFRASCPVKARALIQASMEIPKNTGSIGIQGFGICDIDSDDEYVEQLSYLTFYEKEYRYPFQLLITHKEGQEVQEATKWLRQHEYVRLLKDETMESNENGTTITTEYRITDKGLDFYKVYYLAERIPLISKIVKHENLYYAFDYYRNLLMTVPKDKKGQNNDK